MNEWMGGWEEETKTHLKLSLNLYLEVGRKVFLALAHGHHHGDEVEGELTY